MVFKLGTKRVSEIDRILGEPKSAIVYMSLVMMVPLLVSYLNAFIDTVWVSDLGAKAVSAISVIYPLYTIIASLGIGFGVGTATCLSYHIGRGDRDRAELIATSSMYAGVAISIGVTIFLLLFITPIIFWMGADDVDELAEQYMFPLSLCTAILVSYSILLNLLKGEGAAKKVMIAGVTCALLNIVLDPILIFTFDLGIAGAAWATSLATLLSVFLIYYWYFTGKMYIRIRLLRRPDMGCVKEILSIGAPKGVEEVCSGIFQIIQCVIVIYVAGPVGLMMHSLAYTYFNLLLVIPKSIGSSTLTVGSVSVGQSDRPKLMRGVRFSVLATLAVSLTAAIALILIVDVAMGIFMDSDISEYRADVTWTSIMFLAMFPLYAQKTVCSYLLQIIRKSKLSAVLAFATDILKTLLYFLPLVFGVMTYHATVWSTVIGFMLASAIIVAVTAYEYRKFSNSDFDRIASISSKADSGHS